MDFVPSRRIQSRLSPSPSGEGMTSDLPIPVYVALKRRKNIRQFARCAFDGVYGVEQQLRAAYIWTQGTATVECRFPESTRLRYVWLEIAQTAPAGSTLTLTWNEHPVIENRFVRGRVTLRGRLPESVQANGATIQLTCSTFVPSELDLGPDDRELGVAVRGIIFAKRLTKYQRGLAFRRQSRWSQLIPRRGRRPAA